MRKIIYTVLAAAAVGFTSRDDSFMERCPDTSLTGQTVFSNYNTFKTYAQGLYGVFTNTNTLRIPDADGAYASATSYTSDIYTGYPTCRQGDDNPYALQNVSSSSSSNGWVFSFAYRVNVVLANIDNPGTTDMDKEHWCSMRYFFRAYYYSELIARFGDVPWVDYVLGDSDKEIAYDPRTPRKKVANHVLNDLIYAEEHIEEEGNGEDTINMHAVHAPLSHSCLFEGTWRKYYALGDEDKYFDACTTYSEKLMDSYPELNSNREGMLTSDLKGMESVILYKECVEKKLTDYVLTHVERTSTHNVEMPQHIIGMYLCKDGETIHSNSEYEQSQDGDNSMSTTFHNRDLRLLKTVAPPYKVIPNADSASWEYTSDPKDHEFMDIVDITRYTGFGGGNGEAGKHRAFPLMSQSTAILEGVSHFFANNNGQGFLVTRSSNYVYRYYNVWDNSKGSEGTSDVPLFKIDEVMLNYAEVKSKKGSISAGDFNQTVTDLAINKLRGQVGVVHMKMAEINARFDPKRDQTVDLVLWGIRCKCMVELVGEGFGFYDICCWRKAPWFINKMQYGQWATKEQISDSGQFVDLEKGYADTTGKRGGFTYMCNDPLIVGRGWLGEHYLYQVPTNEITLNLELAPNNPGQE